jgi:hypothetical protein
VEDPKKADLCAQVCGVGGDRAQNFGSRAEHDVIDFRLVLVGDAGDLLRHGEDNMKIFGVEEFRLTVFQPLGAGE